MRLIGREKEKQMLERYLASNRPEFIAVYGRRRVGKTFLISEALKGRIDFDMTGVIDGSKEDQMASFMISLRASGYDGKRPQNWYEAFEALKTVAEKRLEQKTVVIFIDEMPCLDTPRSGLVKALDLFWNGWANRYANIKLFVCGSATTWIVDNIIDNHGGLHNRITHEMHIHPFNLNETESFLKANDFNWNRMSTAQAYMVLGGIPYYLSLLDNKKSISTNIDTLFFSADGEMRREHDRLFKSLFKNPQPYIQIIGVLAENKKGLTRTEISKKLDKNTGGHLTKMLTNLENCDFIRRYNVREKKINTNNGIYQLVDFYSFFYHDFFKKQITDDRFWSNSLNTPKQNTWYGLAYERLCMAHIPQIKKALGINRIATEYYSWRSRTCSPAAQIDLVIDRADQIVNICEMKFSQGEYSIDGKEETKLRNRIHAFVMETATRQAPHLTIVTTYGLKDNTHSADVTDVITMDDLFADGHT